MLNIALWTKILIPQTMLKLQNLVESTPLQNYADHNSSNGRKRKWKS